MQFNSMVGLIASNPNILLLQVNKTHNAQVVDTYSNIIESTAKR